MRALVSGRCVLAVVLALAPCAALATTEFGERLAHADKIRTTDPDEFDRLLLQLDRSDAKATETQRHHLRLLHDYRRLLRGDYEGAFGDALALYDQASDPEIRFRAALLIANTSAANREFGLGLRYLENALQMRDRISTPDVRNAGLTVAGTLYNQYGQFALGRQLAEQALAEDLSPRLHCIANQIRIEALQGIGGAVDEADAQNAIDRCVAARELISANFIRSTLARHWAAMGKGSRALSLLQAYLPEVEATAFPWLIAEAHSLVAKLSMDAGNLAAAEAHARIAARAANGGHATSNAVARHILYEVALGRGDLATALEEYRRYAEAEKARLDEVKAREHAFQLSRHELSQKNQSIALLSKRNEVLKLEQEVAKQAAQNTRLIVALLVLVIAWAAVWIVRAKKLQRSLRNLAETDGLTGLANRRHFRARSEALLAECAQRRQPVSILLFDLDHFKQINDQCGHSAGDWVLCEVARVGRQQCRQGDVFGRIGGEEFAVTLVDCDMEVALRIAEECRRAIASVDGIPGGCTLPVSASIGCVGTAMSGYDYEKLIARADAAMYHAKIAGRNRVCRYEPSVSRPAGGSAHASRSDDAVLQV